MIMIMVGKNNRSPHTGICDIIAGPGECQRQVLCPREGRHQEQEGGRHLRGQEGGLQAF